MPLTNPNKVVTEERLSSFYQDILPYLGGMPEILANKFSRSDIYSTEEKMIGVWTDGKPLYQKVIESELTNFTTSFRKYGTIGVSNISVKFLEYIVVDGNENNYYGQNVAADDEESYAYIEGSTGDFYFKLDKNWTSTVHQIIAIVKYTKTTDSPIAIGVDTDYSTDEKIVGKWIDGSYIYQKTINFGALPNATSKGVNHSISNLDKIVSIMGVAYSSSYPAVPLPYSSTVDNENIALLVTPTQVQIVAGINRTSLSAYITLQYTKTS